MANTNPGPAVTGNANSMLTVQAVNTQTNSNPVESNQLRALAIGRNVNVNAIGDTPLPVLNASRWNIQAVVGTASLGAVTTGLFPNAATSVAIGINTSAAVRVRVLLCSRSSRACKPTVAPRWLTGSR